MTPHRQCAVEIWKQPEPSLLIAYSPCQVGAGQRAQQTVCANPL